MKNKSEIIIFKTKKIMMLKIKITKIISKNIRIKYNQNKIIQMMNFFQLSKKIIILTKIKNKKTKKYLTGKKIKIK